MAGAVAVCIMAAYSLFAVPESPSPEDGLIRITSDEELQNFLEENRNRDHYAEYKTEFFPVGKMTTNSVEDQSSQTVAGEAYEMAPMALAGEDGSYAEYYSTTNIQVAEVDEADFVKNDGKYIYIISGGRLVIAEAYPPENAAIVSETKIEGDPEEIFVNGDKLIIFENCRKDEWIKPETSAAPVLVTSDVASAKIYDISDRTNPLLSRTIEIPGYYDNSRMIGDYVYFISQDPLYYNYDDVSMPYVAEDGVGIIRPAVWCPDIPYDSYVMYTITSFNIDDKSKTGAESFLLGRDNTLFVSKDNVYMAYQKDMYYSGGPVFIEESGDGAYRSSEPVQKTVIHRFGIDNEKIEYAATGMVPGRLLNQFSMDEYEGNLRVATTVDSWMSTGGESYNNVYVLNPDLEITGELENLAPDETIYSARFAGDLLYLVTYKRIDPFFVIDLSNPEQPGILGKLKIPGYSDYLHPLDDTHIIGIGRSTYENEWGGVSTGGVKIALFDVSDLNNPVCIDNMEIGGSGSDSEALNDHRAFLLDKKRNILVIPITEITERHVENSRYVGSYSKGLWNGAYVLGVSPDTGFSIKGKVAHSDDDDTSYYYDTSSTVRRSLFMDDFLYTISDEKIVSGSIDNPEDIISEIELPTQERYPVYYKNAVDVVY